MTNKIRVPLSQPWIDDLIRERDELRAENERLRADVDILRAALQDVVASTGGALIAQDYGRLNRALLGNAKK